MKNLFLTMLGLFFLMTQANATESDSQTNGVVPDVQEENVPDEGNTLDCDETNYQEFIVSLEKTSELINLTGKGCQLQEADLEGADLSGADLEGADLQEANLSGANLNWAD